MKTLKLKYQCDPGHGWLSVKRQLLADLGILAKISTYSYQRGKSVYLEEDCDASILLTELRRRGIPFELSESHIDKRHPIRSYEHFNRR